MLAAHGNAGRVDLRVARVGEQGSALVRTPCRRDVGVHRVGRQVIRRAVTARAQQHGVAGIRLERSSHQVAHHDAARLAVYDDHIQHFATREDADAAFVNLAHQRLVGAEQELLTRLPARVEGALDLRAAERPVVEQPAILARKRNALRHALVDDVHAELGEAVDVGLARSIVAAFHRVVEEAVHAVAVVAVVLRGVDAALRRDAVGAARTVLDAEGEHVVAQLAQRGRRRRPGQAGAHDDDREFSAVRRVDELRLEAMPVPLLGKRAARDPGVELHGRPPAK